MSLLKSIWFLLLLFPLAGFGQQPGNAPLEIRHLLQQVSRDSLQSYVQTLTAFGTRHTLSTQSAANRGIGAARRWVLKKFRQAAARSNGRMTAKINYWQQPADSQRVDRQVRMGNVVAVLQGSDTADHRVFLVTAHLDSRNSDVMDSTGRAPGANDDGSGVAALVEMTRILCSYRPRATMMFAAVCGEEQGLLGAAHLAAEARAGHWQLAAVINNDMIGQSTSSGTHKHNDKKVRVFSEAIPAVESPQAAALRRATGGENDSPSRQLARYMKKAATDYMGDLTVELMYRRDRFLRGGDHLPFQKMGFTAVRMTDYLENYVHQHQDIRREDGLQYGDLPTFMDFGYLKKNTALNLAVLASLSAAPSVPQQVRMDVGELSNYTHLYWRPPDNGTVRGYQVWMRPTHAAMWTESFFTRETDLRLPYSRDNYFFAVQAVGVDGLPSLVVFPGIDR